MTCDPRRTPATGGIAHLSLRGRVAAERYVEGEPARIAEPVVDLAARIGGPRERQLLWGAEVTVIARETGHAFLWAREEDYCGWAPEAALGPARGATHRVIAPATHLYARADLKSPDRAALSIGSRLSLRGTQGRFGETAEGFVPLDHVAPLSSPARDPAEVAARLLGTPYLWGGNSRAGIDCSGLVALALSLCGRFAPGDSDLQWAELGSALPDGAPLARGDLLFWRGHVAMALDPARLIHATAEGMQVRIEEIAAVMARLAAAGSGAWLGAKRP